MSIPSRPVKDYSFANQTIAVDGFTITGFDEDGTVSYEPQSEIFTHKVSADAQTTLSKVNDPRVIATITLMETGQGYQTLARLLKQKTRGQTHDQMTYRHSDPLVGDVVKSSQARFLNWPSIEKGNEVGTREFEILLPKAANQIEFAGQNPAPTG